MFEVLSCIRDQHDLRHVIVAGLICLLSCGTTILLLRQAFASQGKGRRGWLALSGISSGFGIWATHFVAMLGYAPGVILGYTPLLTLASLVIAIAMTSAGFAIALRGKSPAWLALAALVTGLGISAMHYTGMMALELPAQLHWKSGFVLASIVAAVIPLFPAFTLCLRRTGMASLSSSALLFTAAIVGLHFTGMTGLSITPGRIEPGAGMISPGVMIVMVSAISIGLMVLGIATLGLMRRSEAAVRASERQFALLVKGISDQALYMLDLDGRVASWNAGAQRLKGYAAQEVIGKPLATFYTPEDRAIELPSRALQTAAEHGKFTGEGWRMRKDGSRFWANVTIETVRDEKGKPIGFAKITRDVTQRKADLDRIAEIGKQRDTALAHMHQGLCLFDADERIVLRNARFLEMYGLAEGDVPIGMHHRALIRAAMDRNFGHAVSDERVEAAYRRVHDSLDNPALSPVLAEYSDTFIVSITSRRLPEGGWVATFDDITNQRQSEARIAHMALHDGLTGLPNRARLNLWLDEGMAHAFHHKRNLAVAVFDLNRFKDINDSFGHAWGDIVLAEIGRRLDAVLQEDEFAARLGGDEFGLAKIYQAQGELDEFLRRIETCFATPVIHEGHRLHFGASIGVSAYPADGMDRETLLNNADLAMYRAKGQLGETLCFYESSMDESARARRKLANDLREAITRNELSLLYQPQCLLGTGGLSGYEALLRWHHPKLGTIAPDQFIPIAEEAGLIIPIGEWVLQQACREAMRWAEPYRIAVNLSAVQLVQPDIAQTVTRALLETGLPARRLELEITETAIITDKTRALHNLRQIKALGVGIAMDDFGTGYSSLDTLQSFPFDKIKIDKSFLLQSDNSEQAQAIIRAVLGLGQSLNIPVLAEGVETEKHLDMLLHEGCQEAQGYYLGRPAQAPSLQRTATTSDTGPVHAGIVA